MSSQSSPGGAWWSLSDDAYSVGRSPNLDAVSVERVDLDPDPARKVRVSRTNDVPCPMAIVCETGSDRGDVACHHDGSSVMLAVYAAMSRHRVFALRAG